MPVDRRGLPSIRSRLEMSRRRVLLNTAAGFAVAAAGTRLATTAAQAPAASPVATPAQPGSLNIRQNAASLSDEQKFNYVNAILGLKKQPSPWIPGLSTYDTFVLWHRDAFGCGLNAAHMGPAFFPWHRMFLKLFEQQLQTVDPTVSLVYWDWTVDTATDSYVWQDNFMGGDGSDDDDEAVITGPFRKGKWDLTVFDYSDPDRIPWLTRDLGMGGLAPDLPTPEQLEQALSVDTYDAAPWSAASPIAQSFRNTLEGWRDCVDEMCDPTAGSGPVCTGGHELHNRVHLWVSGEFAFAHELQGHAMGGMATPVAASDPADNIMGTMAANSSPNDPVFFLHHTNIDRLWNLWMQRHGQQYQPETGGPVGHNIDDAMWPYRQLGMDITPRMMLDSTALGYAYDTDPQ